jgi:hypothetical protein
MEMGVKLLRLNDRVFSLINLRIITNADVYRIRAGEMRFLYAVNIASNTSISNSKRAIDCWNSSLVL